MRRSYSDYLIEKFGGKTQKISINAGFSCPNRDGTIGRGGCIYCNNRSFTPSYCFSQNDINAQIDSGIAFFARKYPQMQYLPYFQSYTNTFSNNYAELERMFTDVLMRPDVAGLIIGTRPDCVNQEVANIFGRLNKTKPIIVELGVETAHNQTLKLINRGHDWKAVVNAVTLCHAQEVSLGIHLICGLPGENRDMILETVKRVCKLPIDSVKFHQLQILKDTVLAELWQNKKIDVPNFSLEEYVDLCLEIITFVPESIVIERFLASAPPDMILAPKWGLKNYEFMNILNNRQKQ